MLKKHTYVIFVIAILLALSGCFGPGTADFHHDLTRDYIISCLIDDITILNANIDGSRPSIKIEKQVVGVAWNNNFILAEQLLNDKTNYWIIEVETDTLYGPYNLADFENKKKDLGITSNLKLEDPMKYKNIK